VALPGLVGGACGEVQGLPVSDRGDRACGVAVSPFRCVPSVRDVKELLVARGVVVS
jgi:hypothetical protein